MGTAQDTWKTYYKRQEETYVSVVESRNCVDYPSAVSIETYAKCNAACDFCPYPTLDRIGEKMSTELVHKIIDELASVPGRRPKNLMFVRVNEPFLDKRMISFMQYVAEKLPGCPCPQTTNGTPLTDKLVDQLCELPNMPWLKISFNDHDPERYKETMKLNFERTVKPIDRLHDRMKSNEIPFKVHVGRVGNGTAHDDEFLVWCKERWPRFFSRVTRPFDWIGDVGGVNLFEAPTFGCAQWFDLHILADGREAFCCIDAKGATDYNAKNFNVLEMYNRPSRRALREKIMSRNDVAACKGCTY